MVIINSGNNGTKIGFIICILIGFSFLAFKNYFIRKSIEENGIYVKCEVIKSEGYRGGILTTIKYKFNNKEYSGQVHSEYKEAVGSLYFLKILPDRPKAVVFLENNPVPLCLEGIEAPIGGWKEIPSCK